MVAFSYTTTGATGRSTIVRGDVGLISGTWDAGSTGTANIVTGGSAILAYGINMNSGTSMPLTRPNYRILTNTAGSAQDGTIAFTSIPTNRKSGDWWVLAVY